MKSSEAATVPDRVDGDSIRAQFRQWWKSGRRPSLPKFLGQQRGQPEWPELACTLCQMDLEQRLKAGDDAPLVEQYLADLRDAGLELEPHQLLDLIRLEYDGRWRRGETGVSRSEYLARFPAYREAISEWTPLWTCPTCKREEISLPDEAATTATCPNPRCPKPDHPVAMLFRVPEAPAILGLDLGRYTLEDQPLGEGGMGAVYRGRDPDLKRDIAVKMILPKYRGDRQLEWRFVQEAKIASRLSHANIVPIHSIGQLSDGRLCYIMELVRGQTLEVKLKGLGPDATCQARLDKCLHDFAQICQAVAHAHQQEVIHRDLKPSNVMVGESRQVQVLDWGLAKELRDPTELVQAAQCTSPGHETAAGQVLGTPHYMAPEQARPETGPVGKGADVFALGAILCEILTGLSPYRQSQTEEPAREEVLLRAAKGDLTNVLRRLKCCGADSKLKRLARECLVADPAVRAQKLPDAAAVANRLTNYLEWKKWQRARHLVVTLGVALLVAVIGGGGYYLWSEYTRTQDELRNEAERYVGIIINTPSNAPLRGIIDEINSREIPSLGNGIVEGLKEKLLQSQELATGVSQSKPAVPTAQDQEAAKDVQAEKLANAAAALALLGETDKVWPLLKHNPDPRLRYFLIFRLVTAEVSADVVTEKIRELLSAPTEDSAGIRQALILCLGLFDTASLPKYEKLISSSPTLRPELKSQMQKGLSKAYESDPDPGVHSAIDWLLRRWKVNVRQLDEALSQSRSESEFMKRLEQKDYSWRWYVTQDLHTMVIVDTRGYAAETLKLKKLPYVFSISTKEVTFGQFNQLIKPQPGEPPDPPGVAANNHSWSSVCDYCDELTKKENKKIKPFFQLAKPGAEKNTVEDNQGYRLPTETEWEHACRCGTVTKRFYGNTDQLLSAFAWHKGNAPRDKNDDPTASTPGKLMPNQLGLFDIYGNLEEYCIDSPLANNAEKRTRGGSMLNSAGKISSISKETVQGPSDLVGFRIVRTAWKHGVL